MEQEVKVIKSLNGHPEIEVHQKGEEYALYIPLSNDYITKFGEYTDFGPYLCDCIAVKSKTGWGIITLESEVVLECEWAYIDYPFEYKNEIMCDPSKYFGGTKTIPHKVYLEDHDNKLYYGNDFDWGIFDCNSHKIIPRKVELQDDDFSSLKGFFEGLD